MMIRTTLASAGAIALVAGLGAAPVAEASHGRGAAIVPSVDATGTLTLDMASFWRREGSTPVCTFPHDCISGTVSKVGGGFSSSFGTGTTSQDLSDARRAEVRQTSTVDISTGGSGLYEIEWGSCCWQGGVDNLSSSSYGTRSTIFWDGSTASQPIVFDLENIQQEVVRGQAYSDNLDAIAASGLVLSYGDTTSGNTGVAGKAPGQDLDSSGNLTITAAATTSSYPDNGTTGADVAFQGKITASTATGDERGSIEFYWVFDGVDQGSQPNQTPTVSDIVVNATVGDTINEMVTGTDPDVGDTVTLSLSNFFGPGGIAPGNETFTSTPGNPANGTFTWDSTGFGVGTYIATIFGTDGTVGDNGTITINLTSGTVPPIPLPASAFLLGAAGLSLFGLSRRRRRG